MLLSTSLKRKLAATCGAAVGFVLLREATTFDSQYASEQAIARETTAEPAPGIRLRFIATAYCKGSVTASGVAPRTGVAAADPLLLPSGSVIQVESLPEKYNGVYTIMDNGPEVRGRELDLYMWSCDEALSFGRRSLRLSVLRLGWNPRASTPNLIYQLFHRAEAALPPLQSRPLSVDGIALPLVRPASKRVPRR